MILMAARRYCTTLRQIIHDAPRPIKHPHHPSPITVIPSLHSLARSSLTLPHRSLIVFSRVQTHLRYPYPALRGSSSSPSLQVFPCPPRLHKTPPSGICCFSHLSNVQCSVFLVFLWPEHGWISPLYPCKTPATNSDAKYMAKWIKFFKDRTFGPNPSQERLNHAKGH